MSGLSMTAARAAWSACPRVWAGLGAILTASCLLTTSLNGLEGPPVSPDGGGPNDGTGGGGGGAAGGGGAREGGIEAGSESGADAGAGGGPDAEAGGGSNDDGSNADDRIIFDSAGDVGDGAKGPFSVVTQIGGTLRGIAVNSQHVYWVQSDRNAGVVRAQKDGGGSPMFVYATAYAFDVAVDADYVYWSTGKGPAGNQVLRKPIGSTAPNDEVVLFPGAGETLYLALGGASRVFVTGADVVTVGSSIDAGTSYVVYMMQPGAAGIALNGANLFWSLTAGIVRGVDSGQPPTEAVYTGAAGEVGGIATDEQEIYWIASDGAVRALPLNNPGAAPPRDVCRASVDVGDAEVDARPDGTASAAMADIAVDDQWVYFTEPTVPRISKCLKR